MSKKTYIALPYKNTFEMYKKALDQFIEPFYNYIENQLSDFEIVLIEQLDGSINTNLPKRYVDYVGNNDEEYFNLGRNINIGYDLIKDRIKDDDIFMFHPIDILPNGINYDINTTTKFMCALSPKETWYHYKFIAFKSSDYKKVNGFSNEYWGYGIEDHEMILRLEYADVKSEMVGYVYDKLCVDASSPHRALFNIPNGPFCDEMQATKNFHLSGLNNLSYEIVSIEPFYKNVKKYIIR